MEQAGLQPFGHQHVIECPALARADLIVKAEVEQKIENLFQVGVKMVFVPAFGFNEEKKMESRQFARRWNTDHNVKGEGRSKNGCKVILFFFGSNHFPVQNNPFSSVMPTAPSVGGEGTWSDRDIAEGRKLTAISIKITNYEQRTTNRQPIAEIRAR